MSQMVNILLEQRNDIHSALQELKESNSSERISHLEHEISDLKTYVEDLKLHIESSSGPAKDVACNQGDEVFQEIEDRKRREKNVMVYNISESTEENVEARIQFDTQQVSNLFIGILGDEAPVKVIRVGKKGNKPRPIRVIFANESVVTKILKNRNKISPAAIKVGPDRTFQQRAHFKELKKQLEERNDRGENLVIKYIKGIPKIISQAPRKHTTDKQEN